MHGARSPACKVVYDQAQRWLTTGVFESLAPCLREVLRIAQGRPPQRSAAILDSHESGDRAC